MLQMFWVGNLAVVKGASIISITFEALFVVPQLKNNSGYIRELISN